MKLLLTPHKLFKEAKSLNLKDRNSYISIFIYVALVISFIYPFFKPAKAEATITQAFVRIDRHSTGAAIAGSACMETASTHGTETNVTIVFPPDWTISSTASNWVANNTGLPYDPTDPLTQATMWAGVTNTEQATSVSGSSVTWTATDLSDGTFYCFNFTGSSSTIGAAGDNKVGALQVQGGSPFVSNVDWAVDVTTSNADQITVTASVSAQMTFALSSNSVALGSLSPSTTAEGSVTQTVTTNARNGWVSWVKSNTDGGSNVGALQSTVASSQIDSPGSYDGTPETLSSTGGYVLDVDTNTGCATGCVNDEYEGSGSDTGGHIAYNIFHMTATDITPTSGDIITLKPRARSSATTPAASDYTDTLTVVAAGSF